MKNIFVGFFLLTSTISIGQGIDSTVVYQGETYCIHRIQQGETLFQLSRVYQMPYSQIKGGNPELGDELPLGTAVRIPCNYINGTKKIISGEVIKEEGTQQSVPTVTPAAVATTETDTVIAAPGYQLHEVLPKETLYSLGKRYGLSTVRLMDDNPLLVSEGLKTGSKILIFNEADSIANAKHKIAEKIKQESSSFSGLKSMSLIDTAVLRIGLMLPFNFEKNKKRSLNSLNSVNWELRDQTKYFLEYYQGMKLAIDSICKTGVNIQLYTYDTKLDTNEISKIIQRKEFLALDMVFGPASNSNFKYANKLLKGRKTVLVSPYGRNPSDVAGNPNSIKLSSSSEGKLKVLAKHLFLTHKDKNIILVHENVKDQEIVEKLQRELLSLSLMQDSSLMQTPHVVQGVFIPATSLKEESTNVIVSLSTKESFVTKLIASLKIKQKRFDIVLYGTDEWKDYRNVEVSNWGALQVHLVGNLDYRYTGITDTLFFRNYFNKYKDEPSYHSILAYESALIILSGVRNYNYTHSRIVGNRYDKDLSEYRFSYSGSENGIVNKAATVYKYDQFKFIKLEEK